MALLHPSLQALTRGGDEQLLRHRYEMVLAAATAATPSQRSDFRAVGVSVQTEAGSGGGQKWRPVPICRRMGEDCQEKNDAKLWLGLENGIAQATPWLNDARDFHHRLSVSSLWTVIRGSGRLAEPGLNRACRSSFPMGRQEPRHDEGRKPNRVPKVGLRTTVQEGGGLIMEGREVRVLRRLAPLLPTIRDAGRMILSPRADELSTPLANARDSTTCRSDSCCWRPGFV